MKTKVEFILELKDEKIVFLRYLTHNDLYRQKILDYKDKIPKKSQTN